MKDTFLNARLVAPDTIRLMIFSSASSERLHVLFVKDNGPAEPIKPIRQNSMSGIVLADFHFEKPLALGHSYRLLVDNYGECGLDVSEATTFPGFDEAYFYDGPLGASISDSGTFFGIWAPLASEANLKLKRVGEDSFSIHPMKRGERGEYTIFFPENLDGALYLYQINNNGILRESIDPYAKGSTLNGRESVVIDFSKLKKDLHEESLPPMEGITDSIIYEGHIRDLTISSHTDIAHKGTFLGLAEKGRKTDKGHPAGLDYLKFLGITHLQLLPIYDYQTVDEAHPESNYNWGYDPMQYFVPEGSYASVLEDPYSRIRDLKALISSCHEAGIRIVMDIVFNHVYASSQSVLEAVVPNYYFRRKGNGKLSNTSGCGNDLASEKKMVRRLILDACRHWIDEYGIDGFRFDLMGILDVETLLRIEEMAKKKKKDFILYGEGWNMGGEVKIPLGRMENASMLPHFSFFNDTFRETAKAYFAGDEGAMQAFKSCYAGLCVNFTLPARFLDARQSINYVECHDNGTYFDYLQKRRNDLEEDAILERCKMAMAGVMFSRGVPFFHMGQEIGQSKWGHENTYNEGDHYNKFSYSLLDERFEMAEYFAELSKIRKRAKALKIYDPKQIDESIDIQDMGSLISVASLKGKNADDKESIELYNISDEDIFFPCPSTYGAYLGEEKMERNGTGVLVPKRTVAVLARK